MKIYDVCSYRACATSAMRDAKNGSEIIKEISKETGINIEIIGGSEEARIIYSNHLECMADRHGAYLYVDVGGGSTEINFLKEGELLSSVSYNIGTVRLLTGKVRDDEWIRMQHDLEKLSTQAKQINIIGSGGNINKISKFSFTTLSFTQKAKYCLHSAMAYIGFLNTFKRETHTQCAISLSLECYASPLTIGKSKSREGLSCTRKNGIRS